MSVKKEGDLSNGLPPDELSGGGDPEPRPAGLDRATELALIDAALLDNINAFSELFEHYRPALYGLCCRRLNDFALAEDVVQEVFLKAFKNLPNSDYRKPIWPWLAAIAHRMCIDLQRRRSLIHYSGDIRLTMDEDAETNGHGHAESALDAVIASEDRVALWKSLEVLPERQRRAFVLYEVDGLSCADIAAAEGISVGAVKLLLFRARKKMRSVSQSGPLPAIVFPFTWLRWKLQQIEERVRPLLSVYSDGFASACIQAACLGTVAMMVIATGHPTEPFGGSDPLRSAEAVLSATQSQPLKTASLQGVLPHMGSSAPVPDQSQQSGPDPASSLADDVINPNQNATPESTYLASIVASPNYESDHTILASGLYSNTAGVTTYVLFVSRDGGGTWKPQLSRFLYGARLILPPDFPRDGRIFIFGGGLHQSDDGGEIFRMVSPVLGTGVAISPSLGGGASKILMGGNRIFEFDTGTGLTQPALLTLPPRGDYYVDVVYSPDYPSDSTVFVSAAGAIYRCKGLTCNQVQIPNPSIPGAPELRPSPRCNRANLTYAFTPWRLLVSHDGVQTFEEIPFPLEYKHPYSNARSIQDLTVLCNTSSDSAIFAAANDYASSPQFPSGIYSSFDAGSSWSKTSIDLPGFGAGAKKLIATPTGRLLATGVSSGIACSIDLGLTWAPRCPPEK